MKRTVFCWFLFSLFTLNQIVAQEAKHPVVKEIQGMKVSGKLKVEDGNTSGSIIEIRKDGSLFKRIAGKDKFQIDLTFDSEFLIIFIKEGYVTKSVVFSTFLN